VTSEEQKFAAFAL